MRANVAFALALVGAFFFGATALFTFKRAIVPQQVTHTTIKACPGLYGVERCLREQYVAQGAPSPSMTCAPARMPGHIEFSCVMDVGLGGGCYAVSAHRSMQDGFPIIDATSQMSTC